jgi:hypothetical protein
MKMDIDKMVQDLLESLGPVTADNYDRLIIKAINVATIQLDYANYEVGEALKQYKPHDRMVRQLEGELKELNKKGIVYGSLRIALEEDLALAIAHREFIGSTILAPAKRYAKILGLGLDRLVEMYHSASA